MTTKLAVFMRAAPDHSCRVARPSSSASPRGTAGRPLSSCLPSAVGIRRALSTSESHTVGHPHARNYPRPCLGTGRSYKPGRCPGRKFASAMQAFFSSFCRQTANPTVNRTCRNQRRLWRNRPRHAAGRLRCKPWRRYPQAHSAQRIARRLE